MHDNEADDSAHAMLMEQVERLEDLSEKVLTPEVRREVRARAAMILALCPRDDQTDKSPASVSAPAGSLPADRV